jgi:hypothetical protein
MPQMVYFVAFPQTVALKRAYDFFEQVQFKHVFYDVK